MEDIATLATGIKPPDVRAMAAARERQDSLTKPAGSLGRLEELAVQIAGVTGEVIPRPPVPAVVVFAADHGVTVEDVSAYPSDVTSQMVLNFLRGGAAINALAGSAGARVVIVDVGVAMDVAHPNLTVRKIARGTANMATGPAMTRTEAVGAIQAGADVVAALAESGMNLLAVGEMGIGNTTAASALTAALMGAPIERVTGRGTGVDDAGLRRKVAVIREALAVNAPDVRDPLGVLAKVGGLEIAALTGALLCAAARRVPVVLDGFITGAAALVAARMAPAVREYLIAGHVSVEQGHRVILNELGLRPLLDLELRLGEGSGAAVALGVVSAALAAHRGMATFDEAHVSRRIEDGGE